MIIIVVVVDAVITDIIIIIIIVVVIIIIIAFVLTIVFDFLRKLVKTFSAKKRDEDEWVDVDV